MTQNFKPIFPYVFQHADSTQIDSRSKRKLFCAPRRARAWAKSVLASPAQGHSSQIWVCHQGYPSLTQNFKPVFPYVFQHADSTQIDSRSKRKLFCAPRRARAWAKSVLAKSAGGHSSQIWVCHRGYPRISNPSFPTFFSMPIPPKSIPGQNETFLRAAPRARMGKISSGQPSLGPFQPNLGMSPGVPQFDPEFQTHLSLRFSACPFHPNRFPVKTETFLRAAPRARLGKISSGQPSPEPFQPNLGMSPGVPQFDPEFQTHLSLRFSACRFHPKRFLFKPETRFARRPALAPGLNQFWPAQPRAIPAKSGYVTRGTPV